MSEIFTITCAKHQRPQAPGDRPWSSAVIDLGKNTVLFEAKSTRSPPPSKSCLKNHENFGSPCHTSTSVNAVWVTIRTGANSPLAAGIRSNLPFPGVHWTPQKKKRCDSVFERANFLVGDCVKREPRFLGTPRTLTATTCGCPRQFANGVFKFCCAATCKAANNLAESVRVSALERDAVKTLTFRLPGFTESHECNHDRHHEEFGTAACGLVGVVPSSSTAGTSPSPSNKHLEIIKGFKSIFRVPSARK